ncbi:MAG: VTT domain-containing protein [Verrucomicrobia subdivision 3 bacterium]|nr:VTT domain-containing protein [Limisphaerales bacterium]
MIDLPLGFNEWLPATQAVTLALLTFVQEDVPTVSAALLAAAGNLAWQTGLLGCFLGIWIGDALLYLAARGIGRPLLDHPWPKWFFDRDRIVQSERWFAEKGTWLLLSSRFIPGTRLPTYLAAGFLRLSFGRFLLVTGFAVAVWTVSIFLFARTLGSDLLQWLRQWHSGAWGGLLLVIALVLTIRLSSKLFQRSFRRRVRAAFGRWRRWEFWPAWLFYAPVAVNYLRLAIRHRSVTLPTAANPGIFSGGFVGESKIATLRSLYASSPDFTAEAHLLDSAPPTERLATLQRLRDRHHINHPFILKPDVGQRGIGVKLIRTEDQAATCLQQTRSPLVVQRYVPGPHEIGVFYYRFPDEPHGRVFAITEKIFPSIIGDGRHSVEELVWQDDRARFLAEKYLQRFGKRRYDVVPAGEILKLIEAGNHAQGCIFRDGSHLYSRELEHRIDEISRRLEGFFIGRYDIRYSSEDDLRVARNFHIIELNGAASEATNIYDARNSLFAAYRTLFRQWELVFAIGAANRARGCPPLPLAPLWRAWRENVALAATYPQAD